MTYIVLSPLQVGNNYIFIHIVKVIISLLFFNIIFGLFFVTISFAEEKNPDLKNTNIDIILQELPDETKRNILKQILLSEELKEWFSK